MAISGGKSFSTRSERNPISERQTTCQLTENIFVSGFKPPAARTIDFGLLARSINMYQLLCGKTHDVLIIENNTN